MIIEARCCDCDKRIGYVSVLGDTEYLKETEYVKKITYMGTVFTILCDECRDGRIDLEGKLE